MSTPKTRLQHALKLYRTAQANIKTFRLSTRLLENQRFYVYSCINAMRAA